MKSSPITDRFGRTVSYLRLSVTDRCNLRCNYCWSQHNLRFLPHPDILTYEELLRLVAAARPLGVDKVRLTGGEPFVRRDMMWFLSELACAHPDLDLRVTTNATMLQDKVEDLAAIGVKKVNISLDTLQRDKFTRITGRDFYPRVRSAIEAAMAAGLTVKINAVAQQGVNDDELERFIDLARENPLDVRFIEFMPLGSGVGWSDERFWPAEDILERARRVADLEPVERRGGCSGPATMYEIKDGKGRFGLITPLSNHFCSTCNRLRVTSDGRLRTCLFSDREYRLRPLLRSPRFRDEQLVKVLRRAGEIKPKGHELLQRRRARDHVAVRRMSAIGG